MCIEFVSCGYGFCMLLATQGLLLSFGIASAEGQLGHGDTEPRMAPELILCLKEAGAKIQSVSCGFKHTVARSSLGKVFTWGWGGLGQLGHGGVDCELSPRQLEGTGGKKKTIQVAAGYSHSVIMTEGRQLLWFGTCGALRSQLVPTKIRLEQIFPELFGNRHVLPEGTATTTAGVALANTQSFFSPVKINVVWSRTMAVTYITVLDMRSLGSNIATSSVTTASVVPSIATVPNLMAQVNNMSAKWNAWEIDPPYVEALAGLFSAGVMRRRNAMAKSQPSAAAYATSQHRTAERISRMSQLREAVVRSELEFDVVSFDRTLLNKAREVEKAFKAAMEKDPESLSEKERQLVTFVLRNTFK